MSLLLFNCCGYRLLTGYLETNANSRLEARLDENNYDESELLSVKVSAATLAYHVNSKQFIRVDGNIEINGVQYNYVKRRLFNDSLELLCIPNHAANQLKLAKNEFFKLVNDLQGSSQEKKSDTHPVPNKSFSADLFLDNELLAVSSLFYSASKRFSYAELRLPTCLISTPEQPPELIA